MWLGRWKALAGLEQACRADEASLPFFILSNMAARTSNLISGLLTDLYQLTMACGYWKEGRADQEAVFHLFFRKQPFGGGFSIAAGLASAIEYLGQLRFDESDLAYLAMIRGRDEAPLFEERFLDYLGKLRFSCDVDAVLEGTAVFPHEPLLRVRGPILQAQLVETALLNFLNFQSLIATKAARICLAAKGVRVVEFGLRRAQGVDGAMTASRAAYIGGCAGTSNVLAGKLHGIPVLGTQAHSWVMSFDSEIAAFHAYARAMPGNCVLLVDTYNTVAGVRLAVEAGHELRRQGHELAGIRLDSGELAALSIEARRILDEAGFPNTYIVASNDLDEYSIAKLKRDGARIDSWGVGTKLVTAYDQPALGAVYKLGAIRKPDGSWDCKAKRSEDPEKTSLPGIQQVRRFRSARCFLGDAIFDSLQPPASGDFTVVDLLNPKTRTHFRSGESFEDLLVPIFRRGTLVYSSPVLNDVRERTLSQLGLLPPEVLALEHSAHYPVGLEKGMHELRARMMNAVT
jgi:nicotinate phosphoribosyltransferase